MHTFTDSTLSHNNLLVCKCYNVCTQAADNATNLIGASEASPFLVMNVAILSVCLSVMDRHDIRFCTRDPLPTFT